jgi:hypothetical protein
LTEDDQKSISLLNELEGMEFVILNDPNELNNDVNLIYNFIFLYIRIVIKPKFRGISQNSSNRKIKEDKTI